MEGRDKPSALRQRRLLDELFMAYLHRLIEEGGLDMDAIRELVPDHLRPWFDANLDLRTEQRALLPLRPSVLQYKEFGPDELIEEAGPIAAHAHNDELSQELDKLKGVIALRKKKRARQNAAAKASKRKTGKASARKRATAKRPAIRPDDPAAEPND